MNKASFFLDVRNEQVLGSFLDQYFYPFIPITIFTRVTDRTEQLQGIDVRFNHENNGYLVDEKGYLTAPTIQNTFVLELSFINTKGERVEGWFYKLEKDTTHYLLCWADREPINIYEKKLEVDHLKRVEIMLVNRQVLQNYLNRTYEINRLSIIENQDQLLRDLEDGTIKLNSRSQSKYFLSKKLKEKPLNIVMTKNEYVASGAVECRYMVYRDRIEAIQ